MIFVRLAIGSRLSGWCAHSTWPVAMSNTSPARGGCLKWMRIGLAPNRLMPGGGAAPLGFAGGRVLVPRSPRARWWLPPLAESFVFESPTTSQTTVTAIESSRSTRRRGAKRVRSAITRPRRERRSRPPCSGLFIRIVPQRSHHPEAEDREDHERQDHARADPFVYRQDDSERREHTDHHGDGHEREGARAQYTGSLLCRSYAGS